MKYYFIYSAGGGGGEWDALERVWSESVQESLKSNILMKFGDIFINHRSNSENLIRPRRWEDINNIRQWMADNTGDNYINGGANILLDSGSAKIVSWITDKFPNLSSDEIIDKFNCVYDANNIYEKYASIINNSNVNYAVSFDIPNPFKVRSRGADNRLTVLERTEAFKFVDITAKYANDMHQVVGDKLMTTINGLWTPEELDEFLDKLEYTPTSYAVGGMSSLRGRAFESCVVSLKETECLDEVRTHFLGCAGIDKVRRLKQAGFSSDDLYSADCSTPINRSFSDRISNYYFYDDGTMIKILNETKDEILARHSASESPYFDEEELKDILLLIIRHQEGAHDRTTFEARAKIMLHNSDVFRRNALE